MEKTVLVKTLYNYIDRGEFPKIKKREYLRRRGKKKCSRKTNCNTIHPDITIPECPEKIKPRSRVGDWEGDNSFFALLLKRTVNGNGKS